MSRSRYVARLAALAVPAVALCLVVAALGSGRASALASTHRAVEPGRHGGSWVASAARRRRARSRPRRRPSCGSFCRQAGAVGGGGEKGTDGPLCPPYPCTMLTVLTTRTRMSRKGLVRVRLRCLWSRPCVGAFVIYSNMRLDASGRYGGGDFVVGAGRSATVALPLLPRARRLVRRGGSLDAGAYVHLRGNGGEMLYAGGGLLRILRG